MATKKGGILTEASFQEYLIALQALTMTYLLRINYPLRILRKMYSNLGM